MRKSIEFAPDNPTTYASLGGVYLAMGLYDAAEAVLKQSLAIKETYGACSNLGASYLMRRRYEDAAAILEKAATLNPNDPRVWRNLGDAYRFGNHPAQAISCFRRAVELVDKELSVNPADTQALANLALYQAKLGDSLKAQEAIRRALAGKDADSEIRFKASIVYALAGNRPAAWRELRAALDGGFSREEVRTEPELASLRQDPRFISLLEGDHR